MGAPPASMEPVHLPSISAAKMGAASRSVIVRKRSIQNSPAVITKLPSLGFHPGHIIWPRGLNDRSRGTLTVQISGAILFNAEEVLDAPISTADKRPDGHPGARVACGGLFARSKTGE